MASAPFIIVVSGVNQSERNKNLEVAKARSHAARISHSRKSVYGPKRPEKPVKKESQPSQSSQPLHSIAKAAVVPSVGKPFKGNSDPFRVDGLEITPEINRILTFTAEVGVPGQYYNTIYHRLFFGASGRSDQKYSTQASAVISRGAAMRDWLTSQGGLQDECAVLARLSAYASVILKVNPDLEWARMASLKMRQRAITLLRKTLGESIVKGMRTWQSFCFPCTDCSTVNA